jgi:hypothetical protein
MNYWKTNEIVESIINDSISEAEKKNYYIGVSLITVAGMYLAINQGTTNGMVTVIEFLLISCTIIIGVNITFKSNSGVEGKDYISRIVLLSFPILIKVYVLALLIGFGAGVVIGIMKLGGAESEFELGLWFSPILSVLAQVFYFWRISVHLKIINT